jgi:3-mercaptopyruvate sulfurtransferase SseA
MAKTGKSSSRRKPQNTSTLMPLALIGLGAVLIIGVLIWQGVQSGSTSVTPVPTNIGLSIPEPGIQRVGLEVAKTAFDGGEAVFLDVRDTATFASGHIPGAVNIPVGQMETRLKELEADKDKWIITYCT